MKYRRLAPHSTAGIPSRIPTFGSSLLSKHNIIYSAAHILPHPTGHKLLNRILSEIHIRLYDGDDDANEESDSDSDSDDQDVSPVVAVFVMHGEAFGDPSEQITYVARLLSNVSYPIVLMGDFNLMPNGQSDSSSDKEDAFQALFQIGMKSAINPEMKCDQQPDSHRCTAATQYVTDVVADLQIDYIFYRDLELQFSTVVHPSHYDCSDHLPLLARFQLKQ
jgi:hypothetical protein